MRNLKRALSLALASVMLLGMMVVGTSAASYPDVDEKDNVEAIEVLNAVKVMVGDRGNFRPEDGVNRYEMAVITAKLLLGSEEADKYVVSGSFPFTDVPAAHWAYKYVAACYDYGVISGTSTTTYSGTQSLTATQAALIMLRALGYEELTRGATDWRAPVVKQANLINLFKDVASNPNAKLNRNQVAQLALNTLKSDVRVTIDSSNTVTTPDGTVVNMGQPEYERIPVSGENASSNYDQRVSGAGVGYQQLCEKLYGSDLKLVDDSGDNYGRPSDRKWQYNNEDVVKVISTPVAVFIGATGAGDVAKALNGYKVDTNGGTAGGEVNINNATKYGGAAGADGAAISVASMVENTTHSGKAQAALAVGSSSANETIAKAIADETANGKRVEVFANNQNVLTKIVTVTYELGKVSNVTTSSSRTSYTFANGGEAGFNYTNTYYDYVDSSVNDTIKVYGDIAKDDIVTMVKEPGANVLHVYPTTRFVGVQSAFNNGENTITVDGKVYDVAAGLANVSSPDGTTGKFPNASKDYNYYVDQYGFVVKSDAVEEDANYAVVDKIALMGASGTAGNKSAEAVLVFADGTKKTVKVTKINDIKGENFGSGAADKITVNSGSVTGVTLSATVGGNASMVGRIVTYSEKDNEYELKFLDLVSGNSSSTAGDEYATANRDQATANEKVTVKGVPAFASVGNKSGNSETVYIVKSYKSATDYSFKAYVGYQNVPTVQSSGDNAKVTYTEKDSKVKFVFVDAGTSATVGETSIGDVFYVTNTNITNKKDGNDTIYQLTGILNGEEEQVIEEKNNSGAVLSAMAKDRLYVLDKNDDGYVTAAHVQLNINTANDNNPYKYVKLVAGQELTGGVLAGKNASDIKNVYIINASDGYSVSEGDAGSAAVGDVIYYKPVDHKATAGTAKAETIEVLYIIKEGGVLSSTNTFATTPAPAATYKVAAGTVDSGASVTVTIVGGDTNTITVSATPTSASAQNDEISFTLALDNTNSVITVINSGDLQITSAGVVTIKATGAQAFGSGTITVTSVDGTARNYTVSCTATK